MTADPWTYISIALALFFGLLSIYLYFKGRKHKEPRYYFSNRVLQSKNHPEVEIKFRNQRVENLSQLYLVFWNAGEEAIRTEDIPSTGGPNVKFVEGCTLLSGSTLARSDAPTKFEVELRGKDRVGLTFEYLNPGDGAVVEILYTDSAAGSGIPFSLDGRLIDAKRFREVGEPEKARWSRIANWGWATWVIAMSIWAAYVMTVDSPRWWIYVLGFPMFLGFFPGNWYIQKKIRQPAVPEFARPIIEKGS
jgi:hypothetical protein